MHYTARNATKCKSVLEQTLNLIVYYVYESSFDGDVVTVDEIFSVIIWFNAQCAFICFFNPFSGKIFPLLKC